MQKRQDLENPNLYKKYKDFLLFKYNNKCAKCGSDKNLQIDHIVPITLGGTNEVYNLQILCKRCNVSKGGNKKNCGRKLMDASERKVPIYLYVKNKDIEKHGGEDKLKRKLVNVIDNI